MLTFVFGSWQVEAGDDELVPVQQDCLIQHADSRTYAIEEKDFHNMGVEKCYPILVCTGTDVTSLDDLLN